MSLLNQPKKKIKGPLTVQRVLPVDLLSVFPQIKEKREIKAFTVLSGNAVTVIEIADDSRGILSLDNYGMYSICWLIIYDNIGKEVQRLHLVQILEIYWK